MSEGGETRKWVQSDRDRESYVKQVEWGTEMDKKITLKPRQQQQQQQANDEATFQNIFTKAMENGSQ